LYAGLRGSLGPPHIGGRSVCTMRGIHMHNMFQSGTHFWGGTKIRRTTPFREAWVLTPLMPFRCLHGLTSASRHDAQPAPAPTRALNKQAHQLVLVAMGMPDLSYCATSVMPELGGKVGEKTPRTCRRRSRPDPRAPPSETSLLLSSHLAS
jgi:hypothetical protein